MQLITAEVLAHRLPYPELIAQLNKAFQQDIVSPERAHHTIPVPGYQSGTLLSMPAWRSGDMLGVKLVTVFPDNPNRGARTIQGLYGLFDATSGTPIAAMDASELTQRRTASASVLAATYLARKASSDLLIVGTGNMVPYLFDAYRSMFPIHSVTLWGRSPDKARQVATLLAGTDITVQVATNLAEACSLADIISCATPSTTPLVRGEWVESGTHVDLIGGFTPEMRESDDEMVQKASLFVDTRVGALAEAGDLIQPLRSGHITESDILADLHDLAHQRHHGRGSDREITLFKSVGTALEDLAAAQLALR